MLESLIEKKVVAYCKTRGLLTYKFTKPVPPQVKFMMPEPKQEPL